jgi:tetratricopeptide (TPR) repeat protein
MGNITEAITQLTGLLKFSPTDGEAWAELSDLYLSQGMVEQAIFCLEEVLLIQPHAWNVSWNCYLFQMLTGQMHAKLGEIIYSTADFKANAVELSRVMSESMRRYLRSVELCENYLKGYYGLKLVSHWGGFTRSNSVRRAPNFCR